MLYCPLCQVKVVAGREALLSAVQGTAHRNSRAGERAFPQVLAPISWRALHGVSLRSACWSLYCAV